MNNLYYSFRELKKNLFFKIIIIIQIFIAIILSYRVNEIRIYEKNKMSAMEQITTNKKIYPLISEYNSLDSFIADYQIPNKFSNFFKQIQKDYTLATVKYGEISLKKFKGIEKFIDKDFQVLDMGRDYVSVNSLQCSPNFFDIFNISLDEGNVDEFNKFTQINSSQWDGLCVPVILGDSYRDNYKIGEIIESENLKCKVAGFMSANQFFLDKGIYHLTRVKNLNTFIILPIPKNLLYGNINNTFLILDSQTQDDFNYIKSDLENLAKEHDVKVSVVDQSENINMFIRELNHSTNIKLLIILFIVFFVIIGMVVIFISRISARRKEISIHIIHGATITDICIRIFLEHLYLIIMAVVSSICYLSRINTKIVTDIIPFQIILFLQSTIILSILIMLISLIPIYYIKKYKLNYLLKGE